MAEQKRPEKSVAMGVEVASMEKHHGEHCVEIHVASFGNHARDDPSCHNSDKSQSSSAVEGAEMIQVKETEV